ncbi:MAG TPA: cupin domain-containing protein [Burkholderiaceae bacterium]|jgi:50S ribosomal protein L16 3-hydroxylase|nr:cupin domain-containing protein [Burkholderiaceae bacterium]
MRNLNPPLGSLSVDQFMRRHWQRKPLLIRGALPGFVPPVSTDSLFELAARDDVESRLVRQQRGRWRLDRGPFEPDSLPTRRQRAWTLLVQGVDGHVDAVHDLLALFRFVPDARLDDLMISFATDGGGVGPHVDSYDVFLLQAHGRRRWRISAPGAIELVPDAPLRILSNFEAQQEWVLEPGDILYLPPLWGHEGTALGECMTYSIGFRAPSRLELLRGFLADCADTVGGPDPRFGDRGLTPTRTPGRLPEPMAQTLSRWLTDWRPGRKEADDYIGRFLTEPKPTVWFEPPARATAAGAWWDDARRHGLRADRRSRLAYRARRLFINGESFALPAGASAALRALADKRELPPDALAATPVDSALAQMLHQWFSAGWIHYRR